MISSNIKKYYRYDTHHKEFKEAIWTDNIDENIDAIILTTSAYYAKHPSSIIKEWNTDNGETISANTK